MDFRQRYLFFPRHAALLAAVRDRGADGVGVGVGDEAIGVGAAIAKWIVAGKVQVTAGLPPAVNCRDDFWVQGVVELRF